MPVFFLCSLRSRAFQFFPISMVPINYRFVSTWFTEVFYSLNSRALMIFGVRGFVNDVLRYFPAPYASELTFVHEHIASNSASPIVIASIAA